MMTTTNKATETTIDGEGSACASCNGVRHEYRCYGGTAFKRCLRPGCKRVIAIDVASDVTRLWKGWSLAQKREWFGRVYG